MLSEDLFTAQTEAHSADLNYSVLSDYYLPLDNISLTMTANDRSCDITTDFVVVETQKVYFKTACITTCSTNA
jgi:hypothetical protein